MTRLASKVEGMTFPYDSSSVCYIEVIDGNLEQLHYAHEKQAAYIHVKNGLSKLYAVWPGCYTSDLFEIDDIDAYGKAIRAIK